MGHPNRMSAPIPKCTTTHEGEMLTLAFVVDGKVNFWFNVFCFFGHYEL